MTRTLTLIMALMLCPTIANAQSMTKIIMARGVGLQTCGEAMQNIEKEKYGQTSETLYSYWISGFITGRNAERTSSGQNVLVTDRISEATILAMFKNKCRQDALMSVVNAAGRIYDEIESRQQ